MVGMRICKDGFCYKMQFAQTYGNLTPVLRVPALSTIPQELAVAWALGRKNGGGSAGIYLRKITHALISTTGTLVK